MGDDTPPERRAARQVALYARDADECRTFLCALGLMDYLTGVGDEADPSGTSPSMLTKHIHIPAYKIVSPNVKRQ